MDDIVIVLVDIKVDDIGEFGTIADDEAFESKCGGFIVDMEFE